MSRSRMVPALWLCAFLAAPARLVAQQGAPFARVDRIAAIVGNEVIPYSRVDEEINLQRAQGVSIPTDSQAFAAFRRKVLDSLVVAQLLVRQAKSDTTIKVTEAEVETQADQALRRIRGQFASELEYLRELRNAGFATVDEYRAWLAEDARRQLYQERLIEKLRQKGQLDPLPPTERELRQAWDRMRGSLDKRPASVSFHQIMVTVQGDSAAQAVALARAESLRVAIEKGADFADVARRFSADTATARQGGDLGWVRRGFLVKEFEDVAFRLKPGVISLPVKTQRGYHLIEVERRGAAEVQVRHILIRPTVTEADKLAARAVAETVARALRAGASFDSLARNYRDPEEQTVLEGVPRDQLPTPYTTALEGAQRGDIIGPVELDDQMGRVKYAVIQFDEARPEGEYTFEDARNQLVAGLGDQNAMNRYVARLREQTYIEIFP